MDKLRVSSAHRMLTINRYKDEVHVILTGHDIPTELVDHVHEHIQLRMSTTWTSTVVGHGPHFRCMPVWGVHGARTRLVKQIILVVAADVSITPTFVDVVERLRSWIDTPIK